MIRNSKENGNDVFAFGAEKKDESHVAVLPLCWNKLEPILKLLSIPADRAEDDFVLDYIDNTPDGRRYLMFYNREFQKPYPMVAVAKYVQEADDIVLVDMEQKDLAVVTYVRNNFMQREDSISLHVNPEWDGQNADVLTDLAYTLEQGTVFEQDYGVAVQLYELASEAGDARATSNLGWLYQNGFGVDKNIQSAIELYKTAAKDGITTAMVNLGNIYEYGELGEPDYKECFKWYKKAAETGDNKGLLNYANCYHWGYGVRKSYKKAFPIFQHLADKGYEGASFYVGLYYQEGKGVKRDYEQARRYYRLGALEGDMLCFNQLGVLYANGYGVKKDIHAAIDYYKEAARLGDPLAYTNIGWFYESGEIGEVDLKNAISYYKMAADQGEEHALEALNRLKQDPDVFELGDNEKAEAENTESKPKYYLLYGSLVGKRENGCDYLHRNGRWETDVRREIMDHLVGYDSSEPSESPYGFGSSSVIDEIKKITEEEAFFIIEKQTT